MLTQIVNTSYIEFFPDAYHADLERLDRFAEIERIEDVNAYLTKPIHAFYRDCFHFDVQFGNVDGQGHFKPKGKPIQTCSHFLRSPEYAASPPSR